MCPANFQWLFNAGFSELPLAAKQARRVNALLAMPVGFEMQ
jgi:hypothetical protein